MNKTQAETSLKKIASEVVKLNPSDLITLYEIDASEISIDMQLKKSTTLDLSTPFRFHNMQNLFGTDLYFQNLKYVAFPITTEGFELTSAGALPTPTISITCAEGIDKLDGFSLLKSAFIDLENLIGAKVTRIRTYAKFLDADQGGASVEGVGTDADINAEFPRDVFFIERKSAENKSSIRWELASALDLENLKLPARSIYANRCPFTYRGEGCCYEFKARASGPTHGDDQEKTFGATGHLPDLAPPIANSNDELISDKVSNYNHATVKRELGSNAGSLFSGQYSKSVSYAKGSIVYIEKDSIKYYFVANGTTLAGVAPPDSRYWEPDQCSKTLVGCKLRWGNAGAAKNCSDVSCSSTTASNPFLPFGGFPGTNSRTSVN